MKTAISVPDELFHQAEAAACPAAKYLKTSEDDETTRRLNKVYADQPSSLDPAIRRAQFKTLSKDTW